jgi:hypothetical protein
MCASFRHSRAGFDPADAKPPLQQGWQIHAPNRHCGAQPTASETSGYKPRNIASSHRGFGLARRPLMRRAAPLTGAVRAASSEEMHDMAENRWYDDDYRRDDRRSWTERAGDEVRSWFGNDEAQIRRGNDERHDRYPYGGERPGREQSEYGYDRTGGATTWRGGRDFGGDERSRHGSGWGESGRSGDFGRRAGDWGRNSPEYGAPESSRGEWGRGFGGEDRRQYGRGGQYGSSSYDRGQLRRDYGDWTPGAASGARDWENREWQGGEWGRPGPDPGAPRGWGRESFAGRGPKGYRRSDERIREEVSDALTADPLVDASEITVQVEEGHVTLTGTVVAREQKRRAEDVAERISGVSDVSNNLRVNKADYTKAEERRDPAHIVTPSVVAPEGQKR